MVQSLYTTETFKRDSSHEELLLKDGTVFIHYRNIQVTLILWRIFVEGWYSLYTLQKHSNDTHLMKNLCWRMIRSLYNTETFKRHSSHEEFLLKDGIIFIHYRNIQTTLISWRTFIEGWNSLYTQQKHSNDTHPWRTFVEGSYSLYTQQKHSSDTHLMKNLCWRMVQSLYTTETFKRHSSHEELLLKDGTVFIHYRNIQTLIHEELLLKDGTVFIHYRNIQTLTFEKLIKKNELFPQIKLHFYTVNRW